MLEGAGFIIFYLNKETNEPLKTVLANNYKGNATFPKGKIEKSDGSILEAAYRELKEESSIMPFQIKTIDEYVTEHDDDGMPQVRYYIGYTYDMLPLEYENPDELAAIQWVNISNITREGMRLMDLKFKKEIRYDVFNQAFEIMKRSNRERKRSFVSPSISMACT